MGNFKINNDLLDVYVKKSDYTELESELQRLKEKNEELKKQVRNNETAYHTELGTYNMECGNLLEENKNIIEENERLKEESKEKAVITKAYNDLIIEIISNIPYAGEIRPDNITPLDVLRNIKKEQKAYKQALQEIKDMIAKPYCCKPQDVIDKINEVIGAEE